MNRNLAVTAQTAALTLAILVCTAASSAQESDQSSSSFTASVREPDLNRHLDEVTRKLESMRQQLIESQNEMDALRSELRGLREQLAARDQTREAAQDADNLRTSVAQLQDETDVLKAEVKTQDQSKVETVSKYPLRINGAVLFNSVLNSGTVDNINVPVVALPSTTKTLSGSLSATANQTLLGLDVTGPQLWGAHSWGDLNVFGQLHGDRRDRASPYHARACRVAKQGHCSGRRSALVLAMAAHVVGHGCSARSSLVRKSVDMVAAIQLQAKRLSAPALQY
jgi:regulator of replication initiation timing